MRSVRWASDLWGVGGGWWAVGGGMWVVGGGWWVVGGEWWVRAGGVVMDSGAAAPAVLLLVPLYSTK